MGGSVCFSSGMTLSSKAGVCDAMHSQRQAVSRGAPLTLRRGPGTALQQQHRSHRVPVAFWGGGGTRAIFEEKSGERTGRVAGLGAASLRRSRSSPAGGAPATAAAAGPGGIGRNRGGSRRCPVPAQVLLGSVAPSPRPRVSSFPFAELLPGIAAARGPHSRASSSPGDTPALQERGPGGVTPSVGLPPRPPGKGISMVNSTRCAFGQQKGFHLDYLVVLPTLQSNLPLAQGG